VIAIPVLLALSAVYSTDPDSEGFIRRLDGSRIPIREAAEFAHKTLDAAHVTGAQLAVIDRGRLVWSAAYGLRRKNPDLPMTRTTTTWAASITKSVFSTYVMHLVEQGEFDLDEPVVRQLPKPLNEYEPFRDSASEIVKDPAWPLVTPRMLLAHASGLQNFAFVEPDKKMHLHSAPGTRFLYSGEGMNIVQFIIEQKKGKLLDQLMQDALFTPLGMSRTGIIYRQEFESDVADRFDVDEKFRSQTKRFPARASGSMTSSAEDLARFLMALLNDKILRPSTRAAMFKPFISLTQLHEFALRPNEGESQEARQAGLAYGTGWGLLTHTRFGPAFFKEGHGDGAQNYIICFERHKACMILLTNSDNGELTFRPLLEKILGDTVTPWEWEGYTPEYIQASRKNGQ
jgi:CubicO group peptidase (beta-lactamase class C family)